MAEQRLPPGVTPEMFVQLNAELERRRRERINLPLMKLIGAMPRGIGGIIVDREPTSPVHLTPFCKMLETAIYSGQKSRFCFSAPPQHGKTALILFGIAQALARDPRTRFCYASYAQAIAVDRSKQVRDVAMSLGVELRPDVQAGHFWRTTSGGLLVAGGIDGQYTGKSFDVTIIDDPYKNRAQAESPAHRQEVERMLRTLADRSRAIIITHTRWHPDDIIATASADGVYTYVNLPAICEEAGDPYEDPNDQLTLGKIKIASGDSATKFATSRKVGEALNPSVRDVESFEEAQKDAYDWASLYQGRPRRRGGKVFEHAPLYYSTLPNSALHYAIGYDLAYTERKQSDWSVIVVMALEPLSGTFFIVDVRRYQCDVRDFRKRINEAAHAYPGARRFGWTGGQESGIVSLLNEAAPDGTPGAQMTHASASGNGDKFVRAQPVAAAWNDGSIQIVGGRHPHTGDFVRVVSNFTGVNDDEDDDVDALAAAHHVLRPYVKRKSMFDDVKLKVWRS